MRLENDAARAWWRWALALGLAFLGAALLRVYQAPMWLDMPSLMAGGEPIMYTHDAYGWLAGAKFENTYFNEPLSVFVRWLHQAGGFGLGWLGYWLPAIMAPLVALPVCWLAGRWNKLEFGPAAGILAATIPGFYIRSSLGELDTDLFSLLTVTVTAAGAILLVEPTCNRGWRLERGAEPRPLTDVERGRQYAWAFALGIWSAFGGILYGNSPLLCLPLFGAAAGLGVLLGRPGTRLSNGAAVVLAALPMVAGWWTLILPLAGLAALRFRPSLFRKPVPDAILLVAGAVLLLFGSDVGWEIINKVLYWLKPVSETAGGGGGVPGLNLPSVLQSIREAQTLSWTRLLTTVAGGAVVFPFLLAGYVRLVIARPMALVFLPLLLLGLAGKTLGIRFTMFAGPAMGLGVVGLGMLADRLPAPGRWLKPGAVVAMTALALVPLARFVDARPASPVLSRPYAETLLDLRSKADERGWLWLWWDYGYAAQHYAERYTVADGARHTEKWLYPLAKVHASDSPAQAANLMRFVASDMVAQAKGQEAPEVNPDLAYMRVNPMKSLREMGGPAAKEFLAGLEDEPVSAGGNVPGQYLVFSWDNIRIAEWIGRFGKWDVADGSTGKPNVTFVPGRFRINPRGVLESQLGSIPLSSVDILSAEGNRSKDWPRLGGVHLVVNEATSEAFIMDSRAYRMNMMRMLFKSPARFSDNFELVAETPPHTRVYRVKRSPGQ
ncbi:STT3 domain-containing protein [Desulfohalovibrio reitneri]|uniref:STT3 domain-containing protein n=1 Tax=Desulfohalovibrio reitneri TaxID=1307759 RepID=UPI0004A72564|nr:STT3 domain-containing protein [Desulfohalovibrio reitneri]